MDIMSETSLRLLTFKKAKIMKYALFLSENAIFELSVLENL